MKLTQNYSYWAARNGHLPAMELVQELRDDLSGMCYGSALYLVHLCKKVTKH